MKNFDYAKSKKFKKSLKVPKIKFEEYEIPLWALPIAPFVIISDKFNKWNYNRQQWSEAKATKVLDYFLPYMLEYIEEDDAYYYNPDWRCTGWDMAKHVPLHLKKWTKKYGYETLYFLLRQYEKDGFTKTVEETYYDETWIKFKKID